MGSLHHFNVHHLARQHGLRHFIETGTAHGHGLAHAYALGCFDQLDSIEIHAATAAAATARFRDCPDIQIHTGDSPTVLAAILTQPCFFWLDAHFPGADVGQSDYLDTQDPALRWPLQGELDAIAGVPAVAAKSVILIDDLRIYTGLLWQPGRCVRAPDLDMRKPITLDLEAPGALNFPGADPHFLPPPLDLIAFAATHTAEVWHWHEGYLLLVPNTKVSHTAQISNE